MEEHRAREIIASKGYINVTYKHEPVWIEYLNENDNTAHIKNLNTSRIDEVCLSELQEEHTRI